jgi:LPS export ABC transporter protein LptC
MRLTGFKNCVSYLLGGFIAALALSSCETDLKKIQEILDGSSEKAGQRTKDVEIIYSDSATVRARITAPLLIDYQDSTKSYKEMPKGVHIEFYDKFMHVTNIIDAKEGRINDATDVYELHKNVVAKNEQGDVFKSEELILDHKTHKLYSTMPVQIVTVNGNIINGTDFESNEQMSPYTMKQTTGIIQVEENPLEQ